MTLPASDPNTASVPSTAKPSNVTTSMAGITPRKAQGARKSRPARPERLTHFPDLLTVSEVAERLRTTTKAVYGMNDRRQLPGVVRPNRRVLVREDALLDWLRQKSTPSLER